MARLSWRVSGRSAGRCRAAQLASIKKASVPASAQSSTTGFFSGLGLPSAHGHPASPFRARGSLLQGPSLTHQRRPVLLPGLPCRLPGKSLAVLLSMPLLLSSSDSRLAEACSSDGRVSRGKPPRANTIQTPACVYLLTAHWPKKVTWPTPVSTKDTPSTMKP